MSKNCSNKQKVSSCFFWSIVIVKNNDLVTPKWRIWTPGRFILISSFSSSNFSTKIGTRRASTISYWLLLVCASISIALCELCLDSYTTSLNCDKNITKIKPSCFTFWTYCTCNFIFCLDWMLIYWQKKRIFHNISKEHLD